MSNIVDKNMIDGDEIETSLRPLKLVEYVGQSEIKEMNNRIDLYDIKQDILKVMISKAVNNKLPKEENKKILKFIERKLEQNKSPNSVDNRIYSLYKTIKKQVDDYLMFCEIE